MREMCNDFIVDSATVSLSPSGQKCGSTKPEPGNTKPCSNPAVNQSATRSNANTTPACSNHTPVVPDGDSSLPDMGVMDCNTCVLQSIGLAQAFVPFQPNANTMEQEQALICGTAFPDLVMPYVKGSDLMRR